MQGQAPGKEHILAWQLTANGKGFACSGCSWAFPNPNKLTKQEHDQAEVNRCFSEHVCNRDLPLKKFKW